MDLWPYLVFTLFAASGVAIGMGGYVMVSGREPVTPWRRAAAQPRTRARAEGLGMVLIGAWLLVSAVAVDLGPHSSVRLFWVLLVWVALIGGLLGVRHMLHAGTRRSNHRFSDPG